MKPGNGRNWLPSGGKIPPAIFVCQRPNESAKDCAAAESSHEKRRILLSRESSDMENPGGARKPWKNLPVLPVEKIPQSQPETQHKFQASNRRMHRVHTQMALAANLPSSHRDRPQEICEDLALCSVCHLWTIGIPKFSVLNRVKQLQGMSAATCSSCQMTWLKPARFRPSQASQADRVTLEKTQLSQQHLLM